MEECEQKRTSKHTNISPYLYGKQTTLSRLTHKKATPSLGSKDSCNCEKLGQQLIDCNAEGRTLNDLKQPGKGMAMNAVALCMVCNR